VDKQQIDWDPRSEPVQKNQIAGYDEMRGHCRVAHSAYVELDRLLFRSRGDLFCARWRRPPPLAKLAKAGNY